jgi:hypothetical protein
MPGGSPVREGACTDLGGRRTAKDRTLQGTQAGMAIRLTRLELKRVSPLWPREEACRRDGQPRQEGVTMRLLPEDHDWSGRGRVAFKHGHAPGGHAVRWAFRDKRVRHDPNPSQG